MKSPLISFRAIGNSGPLSVYWSDGPFGDAIESKEKNGVVWLSAKGELLAVEFDDVRSDHDYQEISAPGGEVIEVTVKNKKVKCDVIKKPTHAFSTERRKKVSKKKVAY